MGFRVPLLLSIVDAVIHRIDPVATRAVDPPGAATTGFDDAFREPEAYDTTQGSSIVDRTTTRTEKTTIRIPCQVETSFFDQLSQAYQGNLQKGELALVFHKADLELLGLLNSTDDRPQLNTGDRVSALEKHNLPGVNAIALSQEGMFIREVFPASWGFGDSFDLWIAIITSRDKATV